MINIIGSFQNAFRIPDLKKKLLYTLLLLGVYRVGSHIPLPGIDIQALTSWFDSQKQGMLGLYDVFAGGNLQRATIFALGIMPYISASIILQLLGAIWPYLQKLQHEGDEGRKKITQYTRYLTIILALVESYGISFFLEGLSLSGFTIVPNPGIGFRILTMLTLTTGTMFVMWLGEKITDKGIGNGISIIILIGIVARLPQDIISVVRLVFAGTLNFTYVVIFLAIVVLMTAAVVLVTQSQRRIPVQYAKRVVGRKVYGGQSTYIPLNVNAAGVIPIIFAQSIIMFPTTIANFFRGNPVANWITEAFMPGGPVYLITYGLLIIFFAFFYTSVVINPQDMSENMKKYGGFIPGLRPGKQTRDYIDRVILRITFPGAIFFALIAVVPIIVIDVTRIPVYFGGTSILIAVGVILETVSQIESYLLMRSYEGFMKKGRIKGRQ
ncbi:MAG: preprotein translocase subunit SecY [bacterium]